MSSGMSKNCIIINNELCHIVCFQENRLWEQWNLSTSSKPRNSYCSRGLKPFLHFSIIHTSCLAAWRLLILFWCDNLHVYLWNSKFDFANSKSKSTYIFIKVLHKQVFQEALTKQLECTIYAKNKIIFIIRKWYLRLRFHEEKKQNVK